MNKQIRNLQSPVNPEKPTEVFQNRKTWVNGLLFQGSWFGVISFSAKGLWIPSLCLTALALTLHFAWVSDRPKLDAQLMLILALLGCTLDGTFSLTGLLVFSGEGTFLPLWIPQLWLLFATTPRISLRALVLRPWLGALFAMISAPLTYGLAGRAWALSFYGAPMWIGGALHGLFWGLLFYNLQRGILFLIGRNKNS